MPDIEFVRDDAGDGVDEELPGAPNRTIPRWAIVGAVVALAAAAVVLVSRGDKPHAPGAAKVPSSPAQSSAAGPALINDYTGAGLAHVFHGPGANRPVLDVALVGGAAWVLQLDGLHVVAPDGRVTRVDVPRRLPGTRLVADPDGSVVWLVATGLARAYNARTLQPLVSVTVPTFTAAAAWRHRLFLATGRNLLQLGLTGTPARAVLSAPAQLASVVADPSRDRLLVADDAGPTRVWAVMPATSGRARVTQQATVHSIKPTLAVAGGQIWLAGYDTGSGVLMRLDPDTLRPMTPRQSGSSLEPGAALAAGGARSIWVRAGNDDNQLRCVDAATGRQVQSWLLGGPVASNGTRAVVGTTNGALLLDLHLCQG